MENFKFPTAARNLRQFWDRWHISLTTWIKDYLYVPMASRFREKWQRPFVALTVFTLMGIWHGAAWNFVFFGLFAGLTFVIGYSTRKIREKIYKKYLPFDSLIFRKMWNFGVVIFTFQFMILFSFFFRCPNITIMKQMITLPFIKGDFSLLSLPLRNFSWYEIVISILGITILEVISWFRYTKQIGSKFLQYPIVFRWTLAYLLILAVLLLGEFSLEPFIYFQF